MSKPPIMRSIFAFLPMFPIAQCRLPLSECSEDGDRRMNALVVLIHSTVTITARKLSFTLLSWAPHYLCINARRMSFYIYSDVLLSIRIAPLFHSLPGLVGASQSRLCNLKCLRFKLARSDYQLQPFFAMLHVLVQNKFASI